MVRIIKQDNKKVVIKDELNNVLASFGCGMNLFKRDESLVVISQKSTPREGGFVLSFGSIEKENCSPVITANNVDELLTELNENFFEPGFSSASGGSEAFIAYSIGGEWVFNGDMWRGIGDGYNIEESAHSEIFIARTYPFDGDADFLSPVFSRNRKFGHIIPVSSEIVSIHGFMKNEMPTQEIGFIVLVMRLNEATGTMDTIDTVVASASMQNGKSDEIAYILETPVALEAGDSLIYAVSSEITAATTMRNKGSFTINTRLI